MVWIFCYWFAAICGSRLYLVRVLLGENQDSTVRDDWYMDGKTLYADVSKDKLAHDLGLTGQMMISHQAVNFKLEAPAVISLKHLINWQWRFPMPPKSKKTVTLLSNG